MFDITDIASNLVTNGISKLVLGSDKVARTEPLVAETGDSSDFDKLLKNFLPADTSADVSEEELFSAAAGERVSTLKGEDGLNAYKTTLDAEKSALKSADGYVPYEQATINTLKKLVADGTLSAEEGDRIYTDSFEAAQLDSNKSSLFDNRGGDNDPSIAVAKMSEVMANIKSFVERIATTPTATENLKSLASASATGTAGSSALISDSGVASGVSDSGHVDPQGTYVDGSEGFLFKPVTNNEGSLAIMFAQAWTGNVATVKLLDSAGNLLENGTLKSEGIAETGREKYTFSKQGGNYPKDVSVEVTFKDGAVKTYSIPDPSKRYD